MGNRWGTGRIEAFSDGVFAIAITLLVLELGVPKKEFGNLWAGIGNQWPSYLAYATSFVTIGGIWMAHHGIFRRLEYANHLVMRINLVLLMAVAFLPFPTTLMTEAISDQDAERRRRVLRRTLLVIQLLLSGLWGSVARDPRLLRPEVTDAEVSAILRHTTPNLGLLVGITVLAVFAPRAAVFGYLVSAIVAVLRARGDDDEQPAPASRPAT